MEEGPLVEQYGGEAAVQDRGGRDRVDEALAFRHIMLRESGQQNPECLLLEA